MTTFAYRPVTKESQLYNKPVKLSQKQMGDISTKVDKQLKTRSGGLCELKKRCRGTWAVQRAHITGRGHLTHKTTVDDLLHVCLECHIWFDQDPEGIKYKRSLTHENIH